MTPGVIIVGRNAVSTDAVGMAVMGYDVNADRGQSCFIRGDNSLKLAEAAGLALRALLSGLAGFLSGLDALLLVFLRAAICPYLQTRDELSRASPASRSRRTPAT